MITWRRRRLGFWRCSGAGSCSNGQILTLGRGVHSRLAGLGGSHRKRAGAEAASTARSVAAGAERGIFRPRIAISAGAKLIFTTGTDFALGSSVAVNDGGCGRPETEVLNKLA